MSSLYLEWLLSTSDAGGGPDAILIDLFIESKQNLVPRHVQSRFQDTTYN